ncbi:hypothetical protein ACM26V_00540 [Salipaludibacillus sp. HK11]|uniref:hypothetical protein n=1 Tax=Salipaludibacillus sp. HK11 TaxID=3394320 RepID=UPI0039FD694E
MTSIKNKSVAFNLEDPDQEADLLHAEKRTNFSAYVKRLIAQDRVKNDSQVEAPSVEKQEEEENDFGGLI